MNLSELQKILSKDENSKIFNEEVRGCENNAVIEGIEFKFIRCDFDENGDRDTKQLVFSVGQNESLFALDGYHDSWDGTYWNSVSEIYAVTKKTKEVTYYA